MLTNHTAQPPRLQFYFFVFYSYSCMDSSAYADSFALPKDTIEGAAWGYSLEWGYDKNPFLNAWLTRLVTLWGKHADWAIYLL